MLTGANFIGSKSSADGTKTFQTFDPVQNHFLPVNYFEASEKEIQEACILAEQAFKELRFFPKEKMIFFLLAVAEELEQSKGNIQKQYSLETGLTPQRFETEFLRTLNLLRSYADFIQSPNFPECSIDLSDNFNIPELRKTHVGIGPVAVFGASNFPLAYSTVGGDTVAAWVAGCPVIVKSHPMHAGTGELVARCIVNAVEKSEMPKGVFSNLNGKSFKVGEKLVNHPKIKGIGFTGSLKGGRAIFNLAAGRPDPIPVFAEMGSVNPVIIANENKSLVKEFAALLARSVTNDAGQFCTKPGLIFIRKSHAAEFIQFLEKELKTADSFTMLHPDIFERYSKRLEEVSRVLGVEQLRFEKGDKALEGVAALSKTSFAVFERENVLHEEVFGPHVLVVIFEEWSQVKQGLKMLGGQLTTAVFCEDTALMKQYGILDVLNEISGRVVWNGVPTGVMVNSSSNHGGPYPASSDCRFSAVGFESWRRFSRGIVFQNANQEILPDSLKDHNPLGLLRKLNGTLTKVAW
jgi:alpha-ketoglutaric semialdehyde dehydrogenase